MQNSQNVEFPTVSRVLREAIARFVTRDFILKLAKEIAPRYAVYYVHLVQMVFLVISV